MVQDMGAVPLPQQVAEGQLDAVRERIAAQLRALASVVDPNAPRAVRPTPAMLARTLRAWGLERTFARELEVYDAAWLRLLEAEQTRDAAGAAQS